MDNPRESSECHSSCSINCSSKTNNKLDLDVGVDVDEMQSGKENENENETENGKEREKEKDFERFCFECNWPLSKSRYLFNIDGKVYKWHPECFKCNICNSSLNKETSCHFYNDKIVCREDHAKLRQKSIKFCCRCRWPIASSDWVRRVGHYVYHLACFSCDVCLRQLSTGERFTIDVQNKNSIKILCQRHFQTSQECNRPTSIDEQEQFQSMERINHLIVAKSNQEIQATNVNGSKQQIDSNSTNDSSYMHHEKAGIYQALNQIGDQEQRNGDNEFNQFGSINNFVNQIQNDRLNNNNNNNSNNNNNNNNLTNQPDQQQSQVDLNDMTSSMEDPINVQACSAGHRTSSANQISSNSPSHGSPSIVSSLGALSSQSMQSKSKRVRTTFTEDQLSILQTHFQIDSNPDGQDLERIATITGLSKRVTQVWFQNSRARQKKYLIKRKPIGSSIVNLGSTFGHASHSMSDIGTPDIEPNSSGSMRVNQDRRHLEGTNERANQYQYSNDAQSSINRSQLISKAIDSAIYSNLSNSDDKWSSVSESSECTSPRISIDDTNEADNDDQQHQQQQPTTSSECNTTEQVENDLTETKRTSMLKETSPNDEQTNENIVVVVDPKK